LLKIKLKTSGMHNFRKLEIWKVAIDLATEVYKITEQIPSSEKYNLISQMCRSAVSIPSNIAEGAGRNTDGEFRQFLGVALGSCYELETQIILSNRLNFIESDELERINLTISQLQKRLYRFRKTLR